MIPKIEKPITASFEALSLLEEKEIHQKYKKKKRLFSKGEVKVYESEEVEKFATLNLKGLNIYGYEFGIAYPRNKEYPLFIYQMIYVPNRALAIVNYPYPKEEEKDGESIFQNFLDLDAHLAKKRIFKELKPQYFIADDLLENRYNGIIMTSEIEEAYDDVKILFERWHEGMNNGGEEFPDQGEEYRLWVEQFKDRFFSKDYGYNATKRYLGKKWTDEVFSKILR